MGIDSQPKPRVALVAGGSGLTGGEFLRLLLRVEDFTRVLAVSRRPLFLEHSRLVNRVLRLEEFDARMVGGSCTDAFCCIGAAGADRATAEQLKKVDLDLTVGFAGIAKAAGAKRFVVISTAQADSSAAKPFPRIKGQLETALRDLKFDSLDVLQPGRILAARPGQGVKDLLQRGFLPLLNPLLKGSLEGLRGISAAELAAAMLGAARSQRRGMTRYAGGALTDLARGGTKQANSLKK
jgi:uncharacterized protein YbjT (DUF2867 family)